MITVTADDAMLAKLRAANGLVEIRDGEGKVVGFFAPVSLENAARYASAAARIDRAELERRKAEENGGYTTREVFEHLKTLTTDPVELAHLQRHIDDLAARDACDTP
jgi:hypothetical protein